MWIVYTVQFVMTLGKLHVIIQSRWIDKDMRYWNTGWMCLSLVFFSVLACLTWSKQNHHTHSNIINWLLTAFKFINTTVIYNKHTSKRPGYGKFTWMWMTYLFSQGHWKLSDGFNGNIIDSSFPPRKTQTYKLTGHQQSISSYRKDK